MNRKLTPQQLSVLRYLHKCFVQGRGLCRPTDIGIDVGHRSYAQSTSWACPKLYKLVDKGLVEAVPHHQGGHWYRISREGIKFIEELEVK